MLAVNHQRGFDPEFAQIVSDFGNAITLPLQGVGWVIDKLQHLPVEEKKRYHTDIPTFIDMARRVIAAFAVYHSRVFKSSSEWSSEAKRASVHFSKLFLMPLSICHIGEAFRLTITQKVFGNIVKAITFLTLQIFHLIPYALMASLFTGIHFLYVQAPVALITFLAGSILTVQIFLIYRLVKEIEASNEILEEKLDQVNNGVIILKNTVKGVFSAAMYSLRWCASWVPKSAITYCVSEGKKA